MRTWNQLGRRVKRGEKGTRMSNCVLLPLVLLLVMMMSMRM
jgi:hypothetical protein